MLKSIGISAFLAAVLLPSALVAQGGPEQQGFVYETKVEEDSNEVLVLGNGAVVEISRYLGYVGYRRDAVLFFTSGGCRIWIEGKQVYRCTVLKGPSAYARRTPAELVWVERISDNGNVLILSDRSVLEVSYQSYVTGIWLPGEAILLDDSRILHLDGSDEIVDVTRLR